MTSRWKKETVEKYQKEGFRSQDHCSLVDRMQIEFLSVKIKFHENFLKENFGIVGGKSHSFLVIFYCCRDLCFLSPWKSSTGWKSLGSRGREMQQISLNKESTASTSNFRIFSMRHDNFQQCHPLIWVSLRFCIWRRKWPSACTSSLQTRISRWFRRSNSSKKWLANNLARTTSWFNI